MRTTIALALPLMLLACGKTPSLEESYSGPWGDPTSDVMITLGRNHITGCGEFYQKASKTSQGEYAVACTHNPSGQLEWNVYLVWPAINEVTGPDPLAVWKLGRPPRELTKKDL